MDGLDRYLQNIYNLIDGPRAKYGTLKKTELHLHTPASDCYRFKSPENTDEGELEGKYKFKDMTLEDVLAYSMEVGYITNSMYEVIQKNMSFYKDENYKDKLAEMGKPFESFKEYIAYMTIAHKLYDDQIEVAVISDHNTIRGYDKLKYALKEYREARVDRDTNSVYLFLGVEIGCSDLNHLMVIVEDSRRGELQRFLDDYIMGDTLGSFLDTRQIIENLKKLEAITYIAHANTSDFNGNIAYKKLLFTSTGLLALGVNNKDKILSLKERVKHYNPNIVNIAYVLEGDSHAINEQGKKNCYIKMSKINFNSLKKAFINHSISIYNEKPPKTDIYIKGLLVYKGDSGFLGAKVPQNNKNTTIENNYMRLNFSTDLNCIIGGKGTGKSTILNLLQLMYSQETDNLDTLEFLSKHKIMFSIFVKDGQEYLMQFLPQVKTVDNYSKEKIVNMQSYREIGDTIRIDDSWYTLYEINKKENTNKCTFKEIAKKNIVHILNDVFRRGYNINKLVNKISNNKISDYIREVVTNNVNYEEVNKYIMMINKTNYNNCVKTIKDNLEEVVKMIELRKVNVESKIREFNCENRKIIQIEHSSLQNYNEYFNLFLKIFVESDNGYNRRDKRILNYYLTWGDLQNYFSVAITKWNFFEILNFIINNKLNEMNQILRLNTFETINEGYKTIDLGLKHVDEKEVKIINKEILKVMRKNYKLLQKSIVKYLKVIDNFDIKFNVNYKVSNGNLPVNFKRIKNLSLGQKVTALLTFVFNFGIITNDKTPLMIDQPEDNLDNAYIYRTLVQSLINIKNSRQVIIITHSSTIVTNADAEEVIVMESDNENGWIEREGFPSNKPITRDIINYLEGGEESFKHKYEMYKTIIN